MITKTQLEKGCGNYPVEQVVEDNGEFKVIYCNKDKLCSECQATLTQTNKIIKIIEKTAINLGASLSEQRLIGMDILERELLTKIKGDGV